MPLFERHVAEHVTVAVESVDVTSALVAKIDLPRAGICNHLGTVALDDHFAEVQQRDALHEFQRYIHVVLDHHNGDAARDCQQQLMHVVAFVDREAGEGLVEQQDFGFCASAMAISTRRRSPYEVCDSVVRRRAQGRRVERLRALSTIWDCRLT